MQGLTLALGFLVAAQTQAPASGRLPDFAPLARLDAPGLRTDALKTVADAEPARYVVAAAARSTVVYELPAGARTVREIAVEPARGTAEAWRNARLRLTWESDEPADAGVDLPLGLMFGRATAKVGIGPSLFVSGEGPAWSTRLPMPYRTQARLQIDTDRPLAGRIVVKTTRGVDPDAGYLRAASWGAGGTLKDSGRGRIVGAMVVKETAAAGRSSHVGLLTVDGRSPEPFCETVGLLSAAIADPDRVSVAVTGREPASAAFLWRGADPIRYEHSFSVGPGDAAPAVVFWYSERPGPGGAPPR